MGRFQRKQNGELLSAAERAGYEILLRVDQGISQLSSANRYLSIILIRSRTNQLEDLPPLVPAIMNALEAIWPGQTLIVSSSRSPYNA